MRMFIFVKSGKISFLKNINLKKRNNRRELVVLLGFIERRTKKKKVHQTYVW